MFFGKLLSLWYRTPRTATIFSAIASRLSDMHQNHLLDMSNGLDLNNGITRDT